MSQDNQKTQKLKKTKANTVKTIPAKGHARMILGITLLACAPSAINAQGTMVIPFGQNKEVGPAHETYRFPYRENYIMLPLTNGTITQNGGKTIIVNKPVSINSKRPTVIPLGNGAPNVSPTPVVPQEFNGGYVMRHDPRQNQAQNKEIYAFPSRKYPALPPVSNCPAKQFSPPTYSMELDGTNSASNPTFPLESPENQAQNTMPHTSETFSVPARTENGMDTSNGNSADRSIVTPQTNESISPNPYVPETQSTPNANSYESNGSSYGNDSSNGSSYGSDYSNGSSYGNDSSNGSSYGSDSSNGSSYGNDSSNRSSYGNDSSNGSSYGNDSQNGSSYGSDSQNGSSYGNDSSNGSSYGNDSQNGSSYGSDSQNGSSYGSDSSNGSSYGNDSSNGSSYGNDSSNGSSYGSDSQNGSSYGNDSQNGSSYGNDSSNGSSYGNDSQNGSSYGNDSQNGSSYGNDSQNGSSYGNDSSNRSSYGSDSQNGSSYGNDSPMRANLPQSAWQPNSPSNGSSSTGSTTNPSSFSSDSPMIDTRPRYSMDPQSVQSSKLPLQSQTGTFPSAVPPPNPRSQADESLSHWHSVEVRPGIQSRGNSFRTTLPIETEDNSLLHPEPPQPKIPTRLPPPAPRSSPENYPRQGAEGRKV